jgi:hypothetical protein
LREQGSFVFSILHPCFEGSDAQYLAQGNLATAAYFEEYSVRQAFGYLFHRPLSRYLNLVAQSGCRIVEIVEPQLDPGFAALNPIYARNVHVPAFIVVHAVKDST